ncbi:hypothetical protein SK224_13410 [Microbacterium sp. BG28]|uniref:hypothetical protein n=1 Tax=Microbacterium sp. BG28 TaxID=3097356 RepID=UPI002A5AD8C0|nr:hypothetical protein [Microbacterium sp. BG28]MDY0830125.1 hypothetical protein [Microbacterium sp. BG28]
MSAVTYACIEPDCGWRQAVSSRRARSTDAVRERTVHGGVHGHDPSFAVRERWAWLWPLFALNLVWLAVSVYAAVTGDFAVGVFAPQVAMLQAWWIAAIEIVIIAVGTFSYASTVPAGASFWRRAFAGLTMSAFLAMVGNAVGVLALLGWISSAL